MITEFFLRLPYLFLNWLISLFPVSTGFPPEVLEASHVLGGYLGILGPLVPLDTLAVCVAIVFSVEVSIFGFKTLKWLFSHVPLIGGRG